MRRRYVSIGIDGRPSVGSKNLRNGPKNRLSSSSRSISANSPDNTRIPGGNSNSNNEPGGPTVRNTVASTLVPEGSEAIVPNTRALIWDHHPSYQAISGASSYRGHRTPFRSVVPCELSAG